MKTITKQTKNYEINSSNVHGHRSRSTNNWMSSFVYLNYVWRKAFRAEMLLINTLTSFDFEKPKTAVVKLSINMI